MRREAGEIAAHIGGQASSRAPVRQRAGTWACSSVKLKRTVESNFTLAVAVAVDKGRPSRTSCPSELAIVDCDAGLVVEDAQVGSPPPFPAHTP
jgi:hypothetical protein